MRNAADDVLAERQRQVEREGWNHEHDDAHTAHELTHAARAHIAASHLTRATTPPIGYPWHHRYWRNHPPRRHLVIAAALILAEIERMDRASQAYPLAVAQFPDDIGNDLTAKGRPPGEIEPRTKFLEASKSNVGTDDDALKAQGFQAETGEKQ
jgi:hypothetical protein